MIENSRISSTIKVNWGDMDALGHVNNAVFIKYLEIARIDYIKSVSVPPESWRQDIGPILLQISCRYIQPLVYPDTVKIYTYTKKIGNTSLVLSHSIESERLGKVAEGESVVVMFNYKTNEKLAIPEKMKEAIQKLDN